MALLDYVNPSPKGSTWGIGGTCVNVGCIPKKIMHYVSNMGNVVTEARLLGWDIECSKPPEINWTRLVAQLQSYIRSLNWGYRSALMVRKISVLHFPLTFI